MDISRFAPNTDRLISRVRQDRAWVDLEGSGRPIPTPYLTIILECLAGLFMLVLLPVAWMVLT